MTLKISDTTQTHTQQYSYHSQCSEKSVTEFENYVSL